MIIWRGPTTRAAERKTLNVRCNWRLLYARSPPFPTLARLSYDEAAPASVSSTDERLTATERKRFDHGYEEAYQEVEACSTEE